MKWLLVGGKMATIYLLLLLACAYPFADGFCIHIVCVETFKPWAPQIAHDKCGVQIAKSVTTVHTYTKPHSCPANVYCKGKHKARFACSCKELQDCQWASWEAWTGALRDRACVQQRRTRRATPVTIYKEFVGGCGNVPSTCPRNQDSEDRTICRCRKAERCELHPWTAWAGHVPDGRCERQTCTQPVTPHYKYEEKPDNCSSVNPDCPQPRNRERISCRCPTKDCVKREWTQWSLIKDNGAPCPKEERKRTYSFTLRYLEALDNCNNIGVRSCPPTEGVERQMDIKCPRLTAPQNGKLLDDACNGDRSSCNAPCSFDCLSGFRLVGKPFVRCGKDGRWSDNTPVCIDAIDPTITCANTTYAPNDPNTNYASIPLTMASATDNFVVSSVQANESSPIRVFVGRPLKVMYTARDAAGNTATCTTTYIAEDKEPPKVVECPQDIERTVANGKVQVIWKEPEFDDNVEGRHVDRTPTYPNGFKFGKGRYNVIYTAEDKAGNKAICEFKIIVKNPDNLCEVYNAPKNGSMVCNNRVTGHKRDYVCAVACSEGFGYAKTSANTKLFDFYMCSGSGVWLGTNQAPPPTSIARGSRPWQDCSKNYPADAVTKHFKIMAGPCNKNKTKEELRREFQNKMKSNMMIKALFCMTSRCEIDDISVTCSSSKKRSVATMVISFDMVVIPDLAPPTPAPQGRTFMSTDDLKKVEEMIRKQIEAEIQRLTQYLQRLQQQIKIILAHILKINEHLMQITSNPVYVGCPKGSTMSMVGQPPKKLCTRCPVGTTFNERTKICDSCPRGSFQDDEGKLYCKACPAGTTTLGTSATDMSDCKAECRPGTYSRGGHGLATCLVCPKGHYQPNQRQSICIKCPNGKTTASYGSTNISDCK